MGGLHVTIYVPECQGQAREKEEAAERVSPPDSSHLNICINSASTKQLEAESYNWGCTAPEDTRMSDK